MLFPDHLVSAYRGAVKCHFFIYSISLSQKKTSDIIGKRCRKWCELIANKEIRKVRTIYHCNRRDRHPINLIFS